LTDQNVIYAVIVWWNATIAKISNVEESTLQEFLTKYTKKVEG